MMHFLRRFRQPGKPKIRFVDRGRGIEYRWKDRSIYLGAGPTIGTSCIKRWEGRIGMTREEKQKVFTDVLEFFSRKGKKTIVQIERMDADKHLWESLCSLHEDLVGSVEYTFDEVTFRTMRMTFLESMKIHGGVTINGTEIRDEEQLDEVLRNVPLREDPPANISPVDQLTNPSSAYLPMSEPAFIRYVLDHTMETVIETFRRIPDDRLCRRPHSALNPPAWIFGHIAVTERKHVGYFLEGVDDVPRRYNLFHTGARWTEDELRKAFDSKDELIGYWRDVRVKTRRHLQDMSDEELRRIPQTEWIDQAGPTREDPRREWFIMTIQHQNYHWGQLAAIEALLKHDAGS